MLAAERLFADHGIDNVSLRQINAAAGQRNSSAAHYHFGSKDALIRAIYDYRMVRVDARRRALLGELADSGGGDAVRPLVEALVLPLRAEAGDGTGGGSYVRFLAQVFSHPTLALGSVLRGEFAESMGRIYYRLRMLLPAVPDDIFAARFGLAWELAVGGLAEQARPAATAVGTNQDLFVTNLIDACEAILVAPPSTATAAALAALRAGEAR